ncbi:MAG: 5'-nucleotidase C-terminal domain-containing protein, partial [Endozoicomonas sp.]
YILQAWEWGKYVGRADFIYQYLDDPDGRGHSHGLLKMVNYRLIPVNLKTRKVVDGKKVWLPIEPEIPEDPEVLKQLQPYQDKAGDLMKRKVGHLDQAMTGERVEVRGGPAAIGNLLASAALEKTGADLAVVNGGGIRAGLPAGTLTEKDLLKVQPFGNMIGYVDLSGRALLSYVEEIADIQPGSGGMAHFANIRLLMVGDQLVKLEVNGKPVEKEKNYRMAINTFSAGGGDHWPEVDDKLSFVNTGYTDVVVLREYIKKHSPLSRSEYEPRGEILRQ